VVRHNTCKGPNISWKKAKKEPKDQTKILGQQVLFGTKSLKFGPKRVNLATLPPSHHLKSKNSKNSIKLFYHSQLQYKLVTLLIHYYCITLPIHSRVEVTIVTWYLRQSARCDFFGEGTPNHNPQANPARVDILSILKNFFTKNPLICSKSLCNIQSLET